MEKHLKLIIKIIMAILFALCLLKMPYGYYQLVRFIGMIGFIILAYLDRARGLQFIPLFWIASALLINPFLKIALGRRIWNITDVLWVIILVVTIWSDLETRKNAS